MSKPQFMQGLQVIERAIIAGVIDAGGQLDTRNLRWNHGRDFGPGHPPNAVLLEVVINGNVRAEATFAREQVDDSWDRLDRFDIRSKVEQIVETLTKPLTRQP